jgi:hypothetical protein
VDHTRKSLENKPALENNVILRVLQHSILCNTCRKEESNAKEEFTAYKKKAI